MARFIIGMHKFCFRWKSFWLNVVAVAVRCSLYLPYYNNIFSCRRICIYPVLPVFPLPITPKLAWHFRFSTHFSHSHSLNFILCVLNAHFALNKCHEKRLKWPQVFCLFSRHCNCAIFNIVCYNSRRNLKISFSFFICLFYGLRFAQLPTATFPLCVLASL